MTMMMVETAASPEVKAQLGSDAYELLVSLMGQLQAKRRRNKMRADYYDMKNLFRDLGISIPPNLRNLEVAMGWPAKAVDLLARRVSMQGFVLPGADVEDFGVPAIWSQNMMSTEAPQAHVSALIHSTAFIMTTQGDTDLGEPEVMLSVHDAMSATGVWDPSRRGLSSALVVMSQVEGHERMLLVTPVAVADIRRAGHRWEVQASRHGLGRVPVEPLVYRPRLGRPFGSSRVSRAVMSLTNSAMRTVVRAEVGAEFYSAPQRYLLGADEDMFVDASGAAKSTWDLVMGRILAVPADDDGTDVKVGQFPQISMQPHSDQLRMWATMFAGETGLPVSSLGVVQDNPSSAEAIYAAKEDLIMEAEGCAVGFGPAWSRAMVTAVQLRDGLSAPPVELQALDCRWRDPSTPSRAAATDAVMKQISAGVIPPDSPVALEQLGFDQTTIGRILADRRRTAGTTALSEILQRTAGVPGDDEGIDADALAKKANALGQLIRAGVDPEDAANRVGLSGVSFTGATPVSLRLPESDAERLEER